MGGNPFWLYVSFQRDPIQFLLDTYPLGDVVQIPSITGQSSYIVHHPEVVRTVLAVEEDKVAKGKAGRVLGYTLGEGLLTSENPKHTEQRRVLQPGFHASMVKGAATEIVRLTDERIGSWQLGKPFSVTNELLDLTLDVVYHTLFGDDVLEDRAVLHAAIENSVRFSADKLTSAFAMPFAVPTPANIRQKRYLKAFDRIISKLMAHGEARTKVQFEGASTSAPGRPANLLDYMYLAEDANGSRMPDDEIRDHLATLIIGGHETTANLLSWAIYLLAKHPDIHALLAAEVDRVLGERLPTAEDARQMPLLRQVIKETLRMYPPAWTILREAVEDIVVDGIRMKKGSILIISPYVLHRNPRWFTNPDEFIPERFAEDTPHSWDKFAYIPFGAGSRTCIGNTFAQMESALVLSIIIQRFRITVMPGKPVVAEPSVSLRIRDGLEILVEQRSRKP